MLWVPISILFALFPMSFHMSLCDLHFNVDKSLFAKSTLTSGSCLDFLGLNHSLISTHTFPSNHVLKVELLLSVSATSTRIYLNCTSCQSSSKKQTTVVDISNRQQHTIPRRLPIFSPFYLTPAHLFVISPLVASQGLVAKP